MLGNREESGWTEPSRDHVRKSIAKKSCALTSCSIDETNAKTRSEPGTEQEREGSMNTKSMLFTMAFCFTALAVAFAADPNVGSWKLNEAKSKIAAGTAKNLAVVYTAVGDNYKCVVDGVDGAGKPTHNEWTGKFDGKDYPVTGDPSADARSLKMVSPSHYALSNSKDGKTVLTGTVQFSADSRTRTLTTHMTDEAGRKLTSIAVYERQ